uniref:Uncharacterized protein n=1 Tax=Eubacterium plexicaudatum ASF492 TaxID=1235802 RepID=N2A5L3_9FIRM
MTEKMLVTQALDERDLLVKKISDKICKAKFVDTVKRNETKVYEARMSKEDFEKEAKAAFQQIVDLIDRYQKIDAKIVNSNANTYIETSYGKMSVASAIALRGRMRGTGSYEDRADFEGNLNQVMQDQYEKCVRFAEGRNQKLQATAEDMRLSILGKDTRVREDKPLEVVETYVKENTTELADPLGVVKKMEEISEKRENLLRELDTQIKVSNATTYIEF